MIIDKLLVYADSKTKDDVIREVLNARLIKNTYVRIVCKCRECGEDVIVDLKTFKAQDNFHCEKYKHSKIKGEQSPYYRRIKTECANCGNEIKIIPYESKLKNNFGDKHHFCCQDCYWKFRSKYYTGEKHPMYGYKFTVEQIDLYKIRLAQRRCKEDRLNTQI